MDLRRIGVAVVVLATMTACGGGGSGDKPVAKASPADVDVTGRVLAPIDGNSLILDAMKRPADDDQFQPGVTPCKAAPAVAGVKPGAQVVVKNAHGTTVGTGQLARGVLDPSGKKAPIDSPCSFAFELTVAGGSDFYEVAVGATSSTFKADEMSSVTLQAE
jgi:hypothetical protein